MSFQPRDKTGKDGGTKGFQCVFPGDFRTLSYTATASPLGATFASGTSVIWLFSTTDCYVSMGLTATAAANTTTSFRLRGGIYRPFGVKPGWTLSAIKDSTNGVLDIHEGLGEE